MPRFEPFRGIRYAERFELADVTAPPYDVIDDADRAALAARSDRNVVHLDVPEAADGRDRYANARHLLDAWRADGSLVTDDAPAYHGYTMAFTDEQGRAHRTVGVIGALELRPPGSGDVLPHERTTPKARSDRLDLLRATDANLSAVWGLSLAAGLAAHCEPTGPVATWTDGDGVEHGLHRIDDPATVAAITELVQGAPVLIADGHHRYHTSLEFLGEQQAAGRAPDGSELVMTFVVELAPEQLHVRAIHRLIAGLPDGLDLPAALGSHFEVLPADGDDPAALLGRMQEVGALALVLPSGAHLLRPHPGAFDDVEDLDSVRLDVALAALPPHELTYQHGADLVAKRVATGEAQAGVLLRPVTVAQIAATASARTLMPPKSTFFWPKPRTGPVLRSLSD